MLEPGPVLTFALLTLGMAMAIAAYLFPANMPITLWLLGVTLMGAGALCPFRRVISGALIGFIVAIFCMIETVQMDDLDPENTFRNDWWNQAPWTLDRSIRRIPRAQLHLRPWVVNCW